MGLLQRLFGGGKGEAWSDSLERSTQEQTATEFMQDNSALYRHYRIDEVEACVEQFTGVRLNRQQSVAMVQHLRNQHGMGPIADHNLHPERYEEE